MSTDLLDKKRQMKAKKPQFIRKEGVKFVRLEDKWRRPRGQHSKVRQKMAGNRVRVNPGYGTPDALRGVLRDGLLPKVINTVADIGTINPKKESIIIGSAVGKRKRLLLIEEAEKKNIKIINIKDPKAYSEAIKKDFEERKKSRSEKTAKKKEEKKAEKQKAQESKASGAQKAKLSSGEKKEATSEETDEEKETKRREAEKVMITKQ